MFWTPPELDAPNDADEINAAVAYGFIFGFCGVGINHDTGRVCIDQYVTMHDAGRILNPQPVILRRETPSPIAPLGPVSLANAVADALGVADLALPLTPSRVAALLPSASL